MGTKPNENWQERIYEAFTSNVKLDINNPQEGLSGPIVYNMLSSSKGGEQSSVGMTESGIYHLYNDQCIEIIGGQKADGGGVCVNICGTKGDVCITAMSNGDGKVTGTNILLDATQNVEIDAGSNFTVNANKIRMSSNECYITAPRGRISVKDVSWSGSVFAGTSISPSTISNVQSSLTSAAKKLEKSIDKDALKGAAEQAASQFGDVFGGFG